MRPPSARRPSGSELSLPQGQVPGRLLAPTHHGTTRWCGQRRVWSPGHKWAPRPTECPGSRHFSERRTLVCNMGTETRPARRRGAHLVEPLHDHVGEVLVQHGRRDDHLVEGLVVAPDGEVRGLLLLAAAEGHRGQREAGGRGAAWPWPPGPWPCSLPWLGGGGVALETPCPAGPAGLCPRAPCFCLTSALATTPSPARNIYAKWSQKA